MDRKLVKQTVMTSVYGVTFVGARAQASTHYPARATAAAGALRQEKPLTQLVPVACPSGRACRACCPHVPTHPPPVCLLPHSRCLLQIGNRLKERGFEDNQFLYKVSCYSAKVSRLGQRWSFSWGRVFWELRFAVLWV